MIDINTVLGIKPNRRVPPNPYVSRTHTIRDIEGLSNEVTYLDWQLTHLKRSVMILWTLMIFAVILVICAF